MAVVGFGVLFAGVVSSVLAGATVGAAARVHPAGVAGGPRLVDPRSAGRLGSGVRGIVRRRRRCCGRRRPAIRCGRRPIAACRALAARLRADVAVVLEAKPGRRRPSIRRRSRSASAAVAAVHQTFFATPYRPTGPEHRRARRRAAGRRAELAERDRRPDTAACGPDGEQAAGLRRQVESRRGAGAGADLLDESGGRPDALGSRADRAARSARRDGATATGAAPTARGPDVEAGRAGRRSSSLRSTRAFERRS